MSTALLVGRFQPFHIGHLDYVKKILGENNEIIIVIGSAQEKDTEKNPFSARARKEMIRLALKDERLNPEKVKILTLEDNESDEVWMTNLLKKAGRFDVVYAGVNKYVGRLFLEKGFRVKTLKKRIKGISGTEIRRRVKRGEQWRQLVPERICDYIN
ncbi:nicotinamide-nucleotide adenylyltransferase [Candidatus Woesearchaeota archaeon]|nr:nicotinamide-nucleotide adenylyltransferase [Candidatus Woesearchaeota archaeon]